MRTLWLGVGTSAFLGVLAPSCGGGSSPSDDDAAGEAGADSSVGGSSGSTNQPGGGGGTAGAAGDGGAPTVIDVTACQTDKDCTPLGRLCDAARRVCVECLSTADCADDHECRSGVCTPFTTCQNSLDCSTDQVCNTSLMRCVECVRDADCASDELCQESECRLSCDSDRTCTPLGLLCDLSRGTCVRCLSSLDCPDEQHCASSACVPDVCTAGSGQCRENTILTCNTEGTGFGPPLDCSPGTCETAGAEARCSGSGGEGGEGSGGTSGGGTGGSSGSGCGALDCPVSSVSLCNTLPRFRATSQIVDGLGDEFADIPVFSMAASSLPYVNPRYPATRPAVITLRAGWSDAAFHAHVHVADAVIRVDSTSSLWNGDNVQFFVAGTGVLTGGYSGTQDGGATHVIISPPSNTFAARGITIYEPPLGVVTTSPLPTTRYAARLVSDGYEVEVQLPWAAHANTRVSGARFGFNFVVGVSDSATTIGSLELEAGLHNQSVSAPSPCYSTIHPGCDDRTWCIPALE